MNFTVTYNNNTITVNDIVEFLKLVDNLIQLSIPVIVTISKTADQAFQDLNKLFKKHRIDVVLTIDSDPTATDYFVNGLAGGILGGTSIAAVGTAIAAFLTKGGLSNLSTKKGIIFMAIGGTIGTLIGCAGGLVKTHMGLRVKFAMIDSEECVEVEFIPNIQPERIKKLPIG